VQHVQFQNQQQDQKQNQLEINNDPPVNQVDLSPPRLSPLLNIILLKLDFAKAFDTIDYAAMIKIMKQMGFDAKWLGWIETIYSSDKSSIFNGVPGKTIFCKRGVRQGDPLSPTHLGPSCRFTSFCS
jgi:hypothetical protein